MTENLEPHQHIPDPLPDPEPAVPSLPAPDAGVFHHDVPPILSQEKSPA